MMERTDNNPDIKEQIEISENLRHITNAISAFNRIGSKIDTFGDLSYEKLISHKSKMTPTEVSRNSAGIEGALDTFDTLSKELFELKFSNARERIVEVTGEEPILRIQFEEPLESLGQAGRVDHPEENFFLAEDITIDEYGAMVLNNPHTDEWMAMPRGIDFRVELEYWRSGVV